MHITRFVLFVVALSWFISPARLSAKKLQRSHDDCLKLVPGDWEPNFGEEWKQHEAVYWGCRLGASVETIQQWQLLTPKKTRPLAVSTSDSAEKHITGTVTPYQPAKVNSHGKSAQIGP